MASQLTGTNTADADFAEHIATYHLFTNGFKYGTVVVIAILILLAFFTL